MSLSNRLKKAEETAAAANLGLCPWCASERLPVFVREVWADNGTVQRELSAPDKERCTGWETEGWTPADLRCKRCGGLMPMVVDQELAGA